MVTADCAALSLSLARSMLSRFPLIDGHNDLPWVIREKFSLDPAAAGLAGRVNGTHTDIPRLVEGGVGGQFWSVYVPSRLAGDAATDHPDCGGLSAFGRDVVTEMQRLGMLVDLSHVAVTTMNQAYASARA